MTDSVLASPPPAGTASVAPLLLTDQQVIDFIIRGYLVLRPPVDAAVHARVCREFDRNGVINVDLERDPLGEELIEKAPSLREVFDHPVIHGATQSLLGQDYFIFGRYCHALAPNTGGAYWHQDDVNVRHYQMRRLMFLYYPQDVTPDMGPTYVVPGTHLFNTPSDAMQTYGNIRGQVPLTVPAGTVVITHYDLWHSASRNKSTRTRYLVKYYVNRRHEPTVATWNHHPETAIPTAMQRMHHEQTAWAHDDFYKERHLRWRLWSYLLGGHQPATWDAWDEMSPNSRPVATARPGEIQGYLGCPLV